MAAIDLIVLGILKNESLSAYDIQKLVEYRNISKWVKISTPSIYKKVIQLEQKGLVISNSVKEGKMPEKAVYSLTEAGKQEFERLMLNISAKPVHFFLDFNAVIVNLSSLPPKLQKLCLQDISGNVKELKESIKDNLKRKEKNPDIPKEGMAVLKQQLILANAIETWIGSMQEEQNKSQ